MTSEENKSCKTVAQYIIYTWIHNNFNCENITLTIVDDCTILLDDQEDTAHISYKDDTIYIRYSEKYNYKIEKQIFKRPYHSI